MLREILLLPFASRCGFCLASYRFRHFESVVGRSWRVSGHVDCCYGLACCSCGGSRCGILGCTSCGVRVEGCFADDGHFHRLALAHPSPRLFDSFARPIIFGAFFFKIRKHMLGTESRPEYPCFVLFPRRLCFHKEGRGLSGEPHAADRESPFRDGSATPCFATHR